MSSPKCSYVPFFPDNMFTSNVSNLLSTPEIFTCPVFPRWHGDFGHESQSHSLYTTLWRSLRKLCLCGGLISPWRKATCEYMLGLRLEQEYLDLGQVNLVAVLAPLRRPFAKWLCSTDIRNFWKSWEYLAFVMFSHFRNRFKYDFDGFWYDSECGLWYD